MVDASSVRRKGASPLYNDSSCSDSDDDYIERPESTKRSIAETTPRSTLLILMFSVVVIASVLGLFARVYAMHQKTMEELRLLKEQGIMVQNVHHGGSAAHVDTTGSFDEAVTAQQYMVRLSHLAKMVEDERSDGHGGNLGQLSSKLAKNQDVASLQTRLFGFEPEEAMSSRPYNSIGKTTPFVGCVDDVANSQAALEARSYKRELIMMMSDVSHLDFTFNLIYRLRTQGFEHYVVLMLTEEECVAAAALNPDMGCVWSNFTKDDHPTAYWHSIRRLWMVRWMVFARFTQLGVNVMMIDTDNMVSDDPYKYFKADVFKGHTLITAYEPQIPGINCGLVYAQNAAPDGPVVWMALEVAYRTLRWLDNVTEFRKKFTPERLVQDVGWIDQHALFEQDIYNDAACSAFAKRPLFHNTFSPHPWLEEEARIEWDKLHDAMCNTWQKQHVFYPEEWRIAKLDHPNGEAILFHDLTLPAADGDWPLAFGGDPYADSPEGPFTLQLLDWIAAGGVDMFPWPHEPDTQQLRALRVESIMRSPDWLLARWPETGVYGRWALDPPRTVLGHVIPIQGNENESKLAVFKMYNWWNWDVSQLLHGHQVFASSTLEAPVPKVLALSPTITLYTESEFELAEHIHHLIRASVISGRALVWPEVHCKSPWISMRYKWTERHIYPHPISDHRVFVYGTLADLHCILFSFMNKGCHKHGVPSHDFYRMLKLLPPDEHRLSPDNTIFHDVIKPYEAADFSRPGVDKNEYIGKHPPAEMPVDIDAEDLRQQFAAMEERQVVYLGRLPRVTHLSPETRQQMLTFRSKCNTQLEYYKIQYFEGTP